MPVHASRSLLLLAFGAAGLPALGAAAQTGLAPPVAPSTQAGPVVEVALTADEGTVQFTDGGPATDVWMYNGSVPGPTIEAEVGQTLRVTFTNDLAVPTSVEWFGLEAPAGMDGSEIAHPPVPPGGTHVYEIPLLRAALYPYGAGVDAHDQVERGLYGALLVRDPADPVAGTEHLLVLDDVLLDEAGQIAAPASAPQARAEQTVNGREGTVLLVNGRAGREVPVARGEPQRLRVLNASNARFMLVSTERHEMWLVGTGGGLLEAPVRVRPIPPGQDHIDFYYDQGYLLSPGERADLVFTPTGTDPIPLTWVSFDRGLHQASIDGGEVSLTYVHDLSHRPPRTLLTFLPSGPDDGPAYAPPASLRDIAEIDTAGARTIEVVLDHGPPGADGAVTFTVAVDGAPPAPFVDLGPAAAPSVAPGETVVWEVHNRTKADLSFHTQGFVFQPLSVTYRDLDDTRLNYRVERRYLEERDTARLPKRDGNGGGRSWTASHFAQRFDDTGRPEQIAAWGRTPEAGRSGGWLFGSRILEHAAAGSRGFVQVGAPVAAEGAPDRPRRLLGAAPNPTAGRTTLALDLPAAGPVRLSVVDVVGREVAALVDGSLPAGRHDVAWDAGPLASGLYLVRLVAAGGVEARPVTVAR